MTGIFKDRGTRHFDAIENKGLDKNIDLSILDELCRVLKTIYIYIWCNKEQIHQYLDYFENKNCIFEIIIWNKTNPIPLTNNRYLPDKEYCLLFRENGTGVGGTYETKKTVYYREANVEDKKKYKHPTIKPLPIIKNLIENSSNKGDIVLDCFSGSGTTCVAAKELGRQFIGIEIDPEYHKISLDRLNGILANGQISFDTLAERAKDEQGNK
jgi:DNA modification methylase